MKRLTKSVFFLIGFGLVFINCSREFENPYDRDCPPEIWTPQNFIAEADTVNNQVDLTWEQPSTSLFDGYLLERTTDSIDWVQVTEDAEELIEHEELAFVDDGVDLGDTLIIYRIKGIADLNETDWVQSNHVGMPPRYFNLALLPEPDAGGTVAGEGSYEATVEVDIEATANTGYHFTNWTCHDEGEDPEFIQDPESPFTTLIMPERDVILDANFEKTEFTLTLEESPHGSAEILEGEGVYYYDDPVTIETSAADGYIFVNWTDENNQEVSTFKLHQFNMPDHDLTLTANFSEFCEGDWECGEDFEFHYMDGQYVVYGTTEKHGICWMDRNLGADRVPESVDDHLGFGDLFQWGRLADGHQFRNSTTTDHTSSSNDPGHDHFIIMDDEPPVDWRIPQNNNLWQGVTDIINNPCPDGWRLPTDEELNIERVSWITNDVDGAFASDLKWPAAGERSYFTGDISHDQQRGSVWSRKTNAEKSSVYTSFALRYSNDDDQTNVFHIWRASGRSVRCVRDN